MQPPPVPSPPSLALPRKRCVRWNRPGDAHYLTFSCYRRQAFFTRDRTRQWVIEAVDQACRRYAFDVWAWVIMPEHVHLILRPREKEYSISAMLKAIKQPVGQKAIRYLRNPLSPGLNRLAHRLPDGTVEYRFWQAGGGYDRNLCSLEEIWEKIHYIHNNPVRRKLVAKATDWFWSSAADFAGERQQADRPLEINLGSIPRW